VVEEDFPLINNTGAWPEVWLIAPSFGCFNLELIVFFSEIYSFVYPPPLLQMVTLDTQLTIL
jgi:hypothetical protein